MTPEERDIIGRFIARVGGVPSSSGLSGSVPATTAPLPPIDPEADRFIAERFNAVPEARYRLTQMAFVQEAALAEAQNRIKRLEYDLSQARQQAQAQPQQSRGLFGGLFGGGSPQAQQPPYQQQPQYAPPPPPVYAQGGYQPGMFQGGGSGFFGSALRTAAGVAGGVLAADAISSMFEPHNYGGFGGGFGGGGFGGGFGGGEVVNETVVNNYGTQDGGGDPWAGAGTSAPPDASFGAQGGDAWSGSGDTASGSDAWSGGGAADDSGGSWDSGGGSDDSSSF